MEKDKVIVVDDDQMVLHALKRELKSFPLTQKRELYFFASSQEALNFIKKNQNICLIITDQRMPQISGDELLSSVRLSHPDTSAILISAYSDLGGIIKSIGSGIVSFIEKPWNSTHLMNEIYRGIETYKLKRIKRTYITKLSKELQQYGKFQNTIMKQGLPMHNRLEFSVITEPVPPFSSCGDFYYVLKIDNDNFIYLMGDAGGPGMNGSAKTFIIRTILNELACSESEQTYLTPAELLQYLNERIYRQFGDMVSKGIQCAAILFDFKFMNITAAGAGHIQKYILRNPAIINIDGGGPALGVDLGYQYEESMIEMLANDRMIMYTDGMTEIQNDYGIVHKSFLEFSSEEHFTDRVINNIKIFMKGRAFFDDMSLLSVKVKPE